MCWRKFVYSRFAISFRVDSWAWLYFQLSHSGASGACLESQILAYTLKQPFEISISRNYIEESSSALQFEKHRKVRNFATKKKVVKDASFRHSLECANSAQLKPPKIHPGMLQ